MMVTAPGNFDGFHIHMKHRLVYMYALLCCAVILGCKKSEPSDPVEAAIVELNSALKPVQEFIQQDIETQIAAPAPLVKLGEEQVQKNGYTLVYRDFVRDTLEMNDTPFEEYLGCRTINAFRTVEVTSLPETAQRIIRDLVYNNADFQNYMDKEQAERLDPENSHFFTADIYAEENDEEWEKLMAARWVITEEGEEKYRQFEITGIIYDITFISTDFVIFKLDETFIASDAAHGLVFGSYKVVDLENAKVLNQDDVFKPNTFEKMNNTLKNILLAKNDGRPVRSSQLPPPEHFTFENTGVLLQWGQGAIYAMAAGCIEITVPYSVIKPYFTREGLRFLQKMHEGTFFIEED